MDALIAAANARLRPLRPVGDPGVAAFGMFVGAMPGLTATMATALLVPVTFFMPPVPALGAIVTATAMAIFAGDIPAAMLRIPGTPASAAYTDESYAMSRKGELDLNLGVNLVFSVIGGLVGVAILILCAPALAEFAIHFSSFEYFWLALLGLDLRDLHRNRRPAEGHRIAAARARHQLHRHRSGRRLSALHLRQRRAPARHQLHSGHDRNVRGLRAVARRRRDRPAAARS